MMFPDYVLHLSRELRDTVVLALYQDARVTYEGGTAPYVGATLWHYIDGINSLLRQLDATIIPLPPMGCNSVEDFETALRDFDWSN